MRNRLSIHFNGILLFLMLIAKPTWSQQNRVDSLKLELKTAKHDTLRCKALEALVECAPDGEWENYNRQLQKLAMDYLKNNSNDEKTKRFYKKQLAFTYINEGIIFKMQGQTNKALEIFERSLKIQNEIDNKEGIAYALGAVGTIYQELGNNQKALAHHLKSAEIQMQINDEKGLSYTLIYIGDIYNDEGNISKAIDYYTQSLVINEKINNLQGIAFARNNLAVVYEGQGEVEKALDSYRKNLVVQETLGDKIGYGTSLNNIGDIYRRKGDLKNALINFEKSLEVHLSTGNKHGIAQEYNNISSVYKLQKNYPLALEYGLKALDMYIEIKEVKGEGVANSNVGSLYLLLGDTKKALSYGLKSMEIAKELAYPVDISTSALLLKDIYKSKHEPAKALDMYELFIAMRDSLSNKETKKATIKNQLKYEYEKKAATDSIKAIEEKKLARVKSKQEQTQRYFLYGGLTLTLIFGGFMFNRFRITQRQKKLIEEQKSEVEKQKHIVDDKQKEILDSIRYAKRIQQSLLPTEKYIDRNINALKKDS